MTREEYGKIGRRRRFCQKSRIWKKSHMFHWNPFVYVKYCFTDTHVQYSINPVVIWCLGALLLGNSPPSPPLPPHRLSPIGEKSERGGNRVLPSSRGIYSAAHTHTTHERERGGGSRPITGLHLWSQPITSLHLRLWSQPMRGEAGAGILGAVLRHEL